AAAAGLLSMYCSKSRLETRPPSPEAGTAARFTPCSCAKRRTNGDERTSAPAAAAGAAATGAGAGAGARVGAGGAATTAGAGAGATAAGAGAGAGAGAAWAAGAGAEAPSAESRMATTVLTCTVCPAGTLISLSTPVAGAGISASTLSVEISNSGSSRRTDSPGLRSHLVTVPSKMDSPIWGITTSTAMPEFLVPVEGVYNLQWSHETGASANVRMKTSQKCRVTRAAASATVQALPVSRASEVTPRSRMPQGTITSKPARSVSRLRAKPWLVTPREMCT